MSYTIKLPKLDQILNIPVPPKTRSGAYFSAINGIPKLEYS